MIGDEQTRPAELSVVGLVKRYSPEVSVGPISFDVRPGEYFSLLGPSGCGKTTTLRCIAGFETLSGGTIFLGGRRLDDTPPHRRGVGLVFQNYALFPHLSVYQNVAFGLRLAKVPRAELDRRVRAMLDLVELAGALDRLPSELSGGQQQRVAIARAVVMEPRIILFDEPLSNLDHKLRIQMRRELRHLQRRLNKTTIYVTHDQSEALALSDRIAVLSQGRIEQIGTPKEIYERPQTAFVADFIGAANLLRGRIVESRGANTTVELAPGVLVEVVEDRFAPGAEVLAMLRPERIHLASLASALTSDENRFEAEITDVTYLGEDLTLELRAAGVLDLYATTKASERTRHFVPGQRVAAIVAAADVHLLPS